MKRVLALLALFVVLGGLPAGVAADLCVSQNCCRGMTMPAESMPGCCSITNPGEHRAAVVSPPSTPFRDDAVHNVVAPGPHLGLNLATNFKTAVDPDVSPPSQRQRLQTLSVLLI